MTDAKRPPSRWARRYGPWALVTGASDGIGRAFAADAARRGLNLVLVARRAQRLDALATELVQRHGISARVIAADLGNAQEVARVLSETKDLDIGLFVPAAGFGTSGALTDIDPADDLAMLDVNCRAVVQMIHPIARAMAARGRGGIVLLSSIVAFQGTARAANYAATKAYMQVLAEGLRRELRPRGVDVIACVPGPVESGFAARAGMQLNGASPATIAQPTLSALGRRGIIRPGFLSKLLVYSLATAPRTPRGAIMSAIMRGMTSHHDSPATPG